MKRILYVSSLTLLLLASLSGAGTLGTAESEIENLEGEVARAQNERDALLLKTPGVKDDPAVKAKTEALEEKRKALSTRLSEINTRPKAKAKSPSELQIDADLLNPELDKNETEDSPRGHTPTVNTTTETEPARVAEASKPETALSGEGIKSEITYSKKKKKSDLLKKTKPAPTPTPEMETASSEAVPASPIPEAPGLSEIQYAPKKKKKN